MVLVGSELVEVGGQEAGHGVSDEEELEVGLHDLQLLARWEAGQGVDTEPATMVFECKG